MSTWNWVSGIFSGAKDVAEVFTENAEKKGGRSHVERLADMDYDSAVLEQFSKEFHQRNNRNRWDAFVDGLNRLPRPMITIAILSFFILTPIYPEKFLEIAQAYQLMPNGYWALLSIIISFYFGGRMQIKSQDMALRQDAIVAAKQLMGLRQELQQLNNKKREPEAPQNATEQENRDDAQLSQELAEKLALYKKNETA